jgi:uncharacterized membrane protein YidH (DUF202 family)
MAEALDGIASPDVENLSEQIRNLERRVAALEGRSVNTDAAASRSFAAAQSSAPKTRRGFPGPGGVLPVFGKGVLAIAGAYLLRAVAESGTIRQFPVLVVAIVYAGMWLVWAVRTHAGNRLASVTYAITAALILSPLLWESTVRFQVLPPVFTAGVLVAFVVVGLALAWPQRLQAIPWITTVAAVVTAMALIIATRELVPFTVALLAVGLAGEVVACRGWVPGLRALPAIAADLAVWLLIYVMTSPDGVPSDYRPIGATTITVLCLALLAIYGGSIGWQSFGLRRRLTAFEIAQLVAAFALGTFGTLRASPDAAAALGGFFLLVTAACYWGALWRFTAKEQALNRRVYATYAGALLLVGSLLAFPAGLQVLLLCLAAVTAAFLYTRTGKLSLGLHVSYYLLAASILSGLLKVAGEALAGTVPSGLDAGTWMVAGSAGLCCAIGLRVPADSGSAGDGSGGRWQERLLWIVPWVLLAGMGAALVVMVAVRVGSVMLNVSRLSVVRTVVICSIALLLGYSGSRWKRVELSWVAYGAIAFGTLKLLFEDLRFGNAASLVASLLFYGLILILIPRLTRLGRES